MNKLVKTDFVDREYWNIVKGIGIILVVVGHLYWDFTRYIYLFHLPLFFFVSGYLYNEEKYGDEPYLHLAGRIKSSWMKYVLIFWGLILTHNFWIENRIAWVYPGNYGIKKIMTEMVNALFGQGGESFGITLWFVPVSVIATCLLGFIVTYSRKVHRLTNSLACKYVFQFIVITGCTLLGYYLELEQVYLPAESQVSLVVMPFLWIGYILRTIKLEIRAYLNVIVSIFCVLLVYVVSCYYSLDLAMKWVYPYMHIVAFLGIYMCLYIAKVVQNIPKFKNIFVLYGRETFGIMFLHLPLCRFFDWIYTNLYHEEEFEKLYYVIDTVIYQETFWPIYLFIGLVVSLLVCVGYRNIVHLLKYKIGA